MTIIDLGGKWTGKGILPDTQTIEFDAVVPGCVHTDLLRNNKAEDFFWRDNANKVQWIEKCSWKYEKEFELDEINLNAYMEFEGLDVYCDIYLNDTHLGYCDNMFIPHKFKVGKVLKLGTNKIEVMFYSPIDLTNGKRKRAAAFTSERVYTRRIQCTYGWDWSDRFVTCGIYKPVRLCFPDKTEIESLYIYTKNIDEYSAQISFELNVKTDGEGSYASIEMFSPLGEKIISKKRLIVEPTILETFDITDPILWWPSGYGEPMLYSCCISIWNNDIITCQTKQNFGIRTVKILQLPDLPGTANYEKCLELKKSPQAVSENGFWDRNETFSGFITIINHVPIMCKGGNWVPCEPFPSSVTKEKITALVELAHEGNVNMLRVWGGGIFEDDFFYDECDRLGIMVTQDFLMACGNYPENEEWFLEHLKKEAKFAALRLRNHPCLVCWSGDNENAIAAHENMSDYKGRRSALVAIGPVLKKYDSARYFLPSSPYGGTPYGSITKGTTHNTQFLGELFSYIGNEELYDYREFFDKFLARFVAEGPIMGAPSAVSLRKFMTDNDIFGDDDSMWRYHTKTNPVLRPLELFDYLRILSEKIFGQFKSGQDRLFKMQYIEYEWIRITLELFRRNKWFSSGIIFWMYNDCWPASGWSIVDYYALPKAAYYGFKRSANGVIASIEKKQGQYMVYVCNDKRYAVSGKLSLFVQDFSTSMPSYIYESEFLVDSNVSKQALVVDANEIDSIITDESLLICELKYEYGSDRTFFFQKRPQDVAFPEATVNIIERTESTVTVTSEHYVHAVELEGEYIFDDNYFSLLPGEIKKIGFKQSFGSNGGDIGINWLGKIFTK